MLLDEACLTTGLHRKSVIRALKNEIKNGHRRKLWGRPRKYSDECVALLKRLYRASEFICSDKLKVMIPVLIDQGSEIISNELRVEILSISAASIDRYLGSYRKFERRRKNTGTRPGSRIFKALIPLKTLDLIAPRCGYLEADTVAHCGGRMDGEFIWSLTITDACSGWTENRGVMGKSSKNVFPAIESILNNLPFKLTSFNVDNGSEFLNHRLYEYFNENNQYKGLMRPLTRSRSYHKNDNARVEQKNWTHVRQIFGYDRLEFKELLPLMNEIYEIQNKVTNYFVPQFKLLSKVRVGAKIKKKY